MQCLDFWYHMYGDDVDTFNVYGKNSSGLGLPILQRIGTRDDKWYRAQANIVMATEAFQVILRVTLFETLVSCLQFLAYSNVTMSLVYNLHNLQSTMVISRPSKSVCTCIRSSYILYFSTFNFFFLFFFR